MYMQMQMVYDCDWNRLSRRLTATLRVPDSRGSFAFDFWHPAPRGTGYLAATRKRLSGSDAAMRAPDSRGSFASDFWHPARA